MTTLSLCMDLKGQGHFSKYLERGMWQCGLSTTDCLTLLCPGAPLRVSAFPTPCLSLPLCNMGASQVVPISQVPTSYMDMLGPGDTSFKPLIAAGVDVQRSCHSCWG